MAIKRKQKTWVIPLSAHRMTNWVFACLLLFGLAGSAHASVALLMEESYGSFGAFAPTGHAAVYLNHICAETPTQLRMCHAGEYGVVISRYHKIGGYDWIAVPLIPYLYAVDHSAEIPASVDQDQVAMLRDSYRRRYLEDLAPDTRKGEAPDGDWVQLVGSSFDRTIHGFQVTSTAEQDARFIAILNDRRDVSHFNLFFHNCADFSSAVLSIYFPHAIHRNFIADIGLMTPKQVAKSFLEYGKKHPELEMSSFIIPQVPGSVARSHAVCGITESLIKSKKYLLPLAVLNPEVTGGVVVAYLAQGRMKLPKDAPLFNLEDEEIDGAPPRAEPAALLVEPSLQSGGAFAAPSFMSAPLR
jgi:hypothetical protein